MERLVRRLEQVMAAAEPERQRKLEEGLFVWGFEEEVGSLGKQDECCVTACILLACAGHLNARPFPSSS